MSMKAIKDLYDKVIGFFPLARTATTNGTGVDLANALENEFCWFLGTWTDGTHTPKLQESTDNSSWSDVAAADQVGTLSAISSNASVGLTQSVSYIGSKRYVRFVVTRAGTTTGIVDAAYANLKLRKQP